MPTLVRLPALGESVTEGTISCWLKKVGDPVEVDEPLVEVSTDKVDTEIPAPVSGVLLEIRVAENATTAVGSVIALIGTPTAPGDDLAPQPGQAPMDTPAPAPVASTPAPEPAPMAPAGRTAEAVLEFGEVTPVVRKLAEANHIDLSSITGTGMGGRIRKQDVMAAIAEAKRGAETAASAAGPAPAQERGLPAPTADEPSPDASKRGTTEKMTRIRATIAARMVESLRVSAQLTATVEVDLSSISKLRAKVMDEFRAREGVGLSYLSFIAKATLEALRQLPKLNATIDTEADTITYADAEHLGIAVDTERGLMVPVIQNAGELSVTGLARRIGDLAARSRSNQVTSDELSGGTFTITNYGSAGTLFDTPIINQPQVGILGTGALARRPIVAEDPYLGDVIAVRDLMYLSLSYDHRLVDGADAARFLGLVKARLEGGEFEL